MGEGVGMMVDDGGHAELGSATTKQDGKGKKVVPQR